MIVKVLKGTYEIVQKKHIILITDTLGAGVGLGFIHKTQKIFGLLSYIFPYKEFDLEIDGSIIYSGETLLAHFQFELERLKLNLNEAIWILAGASVYKENSSILDLADKNLKVVEAWLKRMGIFDRVTMEVKKNCPLILAINGKEGIFEVRTKKKVE